MNKNVIICDNAKMRWHSPWRYGSWVNLRPGAIGTPRDAKFENAVIKIPSLRPCIFNSIIMMVAFFPPNISQQHAGRSEDTTAVKIRVSVFWEMVRQPDVMPGYFRRQAVAAFGVGAVGKWQFQTASNCYSRFGFGPFWSGGLGFRWEDGCSGVPRPEWTCDRESAWFLVLLKPRSHPQRKSWPLHVDSKFGWLLL